MQLIKVKLPENIDQFSLFQKLSSQKINVYSVYSSQGHLYFSIRKQDIKPFRKIRKSLKIPVSLQDEAKQETVTIYSYTIVGVLLFLLIPILLSQFIWRIDIVSYSPESKVLIEEQLKEMKIKEKMLASNLPSEQEIRQNLLLKNKEFSWIHFTKSGSTFTVTPMLAPKLQQREVKKAPAIHLIAKRSGVITDFSLVKGVRAVEKNVSVKKGDILVNGFVKQGDKTVITSAEGKVYASYWVELNFEVPTKVTLMEPSNKEFVIQRKGKNEQKYWKEISLPQFIRPYISAGYVQSSEKVSYQITEESMDTLIRPLLFQKILDEMPAETQILEDKVLQVSLQNDKVKGKLLLLINENIAIPQVIPQGDGA